MIVNDSTECPLCSLEPPPDMILWIPPPPVPAFLVHPSEYYPSDGLPLFDHYNSSPCKYWCEWRAEGVQYVEMPHQGTFFDDTWLLVLISSCVGVVFIGIIIAALLIKCKLQPEVSPSNDDASQYSNRSNKNSTLSTSTVSSGMQTTTTSGAPPCAPGKPVSRFQTQAVLCPCTTQQESLQDSRLMWATLTPRGTTRHYIEDHTYESIENSPSRMISTSLEVVDQQQNQLQWQPRQQHHHHHHHHHHQQQHHHHHHQQQQQQHHKRSYSESPSERVNLKAIPPIYLSLYSDTYIEPPSSPPILTRSKNEKAFDNTAFVDYEDPLSIKNEYYQLEDVLEPCDRIFSVQGLYGVPVRGPRSGTLRPRVSSPTRIEHPNLPPLNLQPQRKQPPVRANPHTSECALLRGGMSSSGYVPTI